jgi:hypothetical protein
VILGYELSNHYYGIDEGMGPNARHNILGLYLFGFYGAIAFSFLCGAVLARVRARPLFGSRTALAVALYLMMNVVSVSAMVDPSMAVGYIIKLAIVVGAAYGCARLLGLLSGSPLTPSNQVSDASLGGRADE